MIPVLALLTGATVWGLIWYPYRVLAQAGVDAALATTLTYVGALVLAVIGFRPRFRVSWILLAIALTAGWANVSFTLAVVYGDVMRVVLLFYLSPLWTILFARWILDERLTAGGYGLMLLALAGAAVMLWQPHMGWPLPATAAEWTGASAGAMFALSNVLIRKNATLSIESKVVAIFFGGIVMGALCVMVLPPARDAWTSVLDTAWLLGLLALVILAVNIAVQHGLTQLSANRAIVIYLFELVVTAIGAWLLADEMLSIQEWCGGVMIIAAGLLSDRLGPNPVAEPSARLESAAAPRS
ncbi:MAG: hypothetical protein JWN94_4725 [Betaproteobacteria bacterium]|nr:hypothetical protein [Betaproteobacteria bacterium]